MYHAGLGDIVFPNTFLLLITIIILLLLYSKSLPTFKKRISTQTHVFTTEIPGLCNLIGHIVVQNDFDQGFFSVNL